MSKPDMRGITRRGPSYRFTVYLGKKPDGRQLRQYLTWRPPYGTPRRKADRLASEAYRAFRDRCLRCGELRENMRFSELCTLYFAHYAPAQLKEVTIYNYVSAVRNHLLPAFGALRLRQITAPRLSRYFVTECPLSPPSCRKLKSVLSGILNFAVSQGYLAENPCKNALCRRAPRQEAAVLTQSQAALLSAYLRADASPESAVLFLLLHTGLRVGEALALQWQDVDFARGVLRICRTLSSAGSGCYLSEPKTRASIRCVCLSPEVLTALRAFRASMTAASVPGVPHDLIFRAKSGGFLRRESVRRYLYRAADALSFPRCPVHALRHTFASLMINSGVHLKAVSAILGHSSVSVTGDIYAHVFAEYQAAAASAVSLRLG